MLVKAIRAIRGKHLMLLLTLSLTEFVNRARVLELLA